jgi:hypothetical protein
MMIINVHITVKTGGAVAVGSSALLGIGNHRTARCPSSDRRHTAYPTTNPPNHNVAMELIQLPLMPQMLKVSPALPNGDAANHPASDVKVKTRVAPSVGLLSSCTK